MMPQNVSRTARQWWAAMLVEGGCREQRVLDLIKGLGKLACKFWFLKLRGTSSLHIYCVSLGEEIHPLGTGHSSADLFTPPLFRAGKTEVR